MKVKGEIWFCCIHVDEWVNTYARCSLVVKALGKKPEGRGFEIRLGEILKLPDPSGRIRPWSLLSL
jgi:hypothetical protein